MHTTGHNRQCCLPRPPAARPQQPYPGITWANGDTGASSRSGTIGIAGICLGGGPAETIFTLTVLFGTLFVVGMAWLQMVRIHRAGSVWAAYRRSFRAVTAGLGALTIGIFLVRTVSILKEQSWWFDELVKIDLYVALMLVVPSALWLGLAWFSGAVQAAEAEPAELDLPPRCEGCGYDLTHQPADGRCTECGMEVALSLTPDQRRPGSPWRLTPSLRAWITTTRMVLFSPQRFYGTLQLRTPDSTERGFAAWHYTALVCGAWLWAHILFLAITLKDRLIYGGSSLVDYEAELFFGLLAAAAQRHVRLLVGTSRHCGNYRKLLDGETEPAGQPLGRQNRGL